ncbi:MAG: hypothetical protein AB1352_04055 [Patescibacteria group bacterium]
MSKEIPSSKSKFVLTVVRRFFLSVVMVVFVYFFIRDINPSGMLNVKYDFCKPSPYLSALSPMGRVLPLERADGYCFQRMVIDPIYVDVRLPQRYDAVTVSAEYRKPKEQPLSIGVRTSLFEWQWKMERLDDDGQEEWQTQKVQFDLLNIPLDHRRVRFIISSSGLADLGKEIEFRELTFTFKKPSLNIAMVKRWLASFVE